MTSADALWDARAHHAARRERLVQRSSIRRAVEGWFAQGGFTEVETAQLQTSPGNETHLHALATTLRATDGREAPLYLHTSPEFACKRLLSAGETQIFTLARVFRNRERGALHAPEFTMLEWYRAGAPYTQLMEDCAALLALAAATAGRDVWHWRGRSMNAHLPPERLSVADAFQRLAGIDLMATCDAQSTNVGALAHAAKAVGIRTAPDDSWSDIFSRILVEKIEPNLGLGRATILMDYPAPEAALARRKPDDPRFAERFELYACGVELANAFGELTDPVEQRARFEADMDLKEAIYGERYPLDEVFLTALAHMPEASGAALGFDRLVMLATGASHIDDVLWTPPVDPFTQRA
jgi:elongation factor P--(R)-beta-lysine ligase